MHKVFCSGGRIDKQNSIYYHIAEGMRESNLSVHDLQSRMRLTESLMLQIMDTRTRFLCLQRSRD